jgi:hypothetical protein
MRLLTQGTEVMLLEEEEEVEVTEGLRQADPGKIEVAAKVAEEAGEEPVIGEAGEVTGAEGDESYPLQ